MAAKVLPRIQFASNLQVSTKMLSESSKLIKPTAPILALLGDIGVPHCNRTKAFMKWAEGNFDHVFWIPGSLEYSSPNNQLTQWTERSDQIYASIQSWGLFRTSFSQKLEYTLPNAGLTILATPLGFYSHPQRQHYSFTEKGEIGPMSKKQLTSHFIDELHWLTMRLSQNESPNLILSYRPVPHAFSYFLSRNHCIANTYGLNRPACISPTNTIPLTTINMLSQPGFNPSSFIEIASINNNLKANLKLQ